MIQFSPFLLLSLRQAHTFPSIYIYMYFVWLFCFFLHLFSVLKCSSLRISRRRVKLRMHWKKEKAAAILCYQLPSSSVTAFFSTCFNCQTENCISLIRCAHFISIYLHFCSWNNNVQCGPVQCEPKHIHCTHCIIYIHISKGALIYL